MRSFFRELRRRNVYRAGAAYAVVGWLIVQIATQVLPLFDVPPLVLRLLVLVILAGFPLALVLSWVYELTPQGIVRTGEVAPSESITHRTGQRLNILIIGVLAIAVLFLLAQRYLFPQRATTPNAAISDKSIAVMPFENLSEDKSNAFFAQGIQDEILTRLAKIGALKVISRTSTQHYASSPDNLPEIARQLGVANILEGSVQKIGDAVHINVQLIRAATDDHLWAEIYNRKLDDIFAVEGEVAETIAQKLNAELSGSEKIALADKPTQNVAALEAYLRGRALDTAGYNYAVVRTAIDAYSEAVRLDPGFALAWAQLSQLEGYLYFNNVDPERFTAESVKHAIDMAEQLGPDLAETQIAKAAYYYRVPRDFDSAARALEAARKQSPGSARVIQLQGLVERRQGRWDEALKHLEQASSLDPRNEGLMVAIGGETYTNLRRFDEARQWLDRALALEPNDALGSSYRANTYVYEGRLDRAAEILDPIPAKDIDPSRGFWRVYLHILQRRNAEAITEAKGLLARPDTSLEGWRTRINLYLAFAELRAGDAAGAKETFAALIERTEPIKDRVDDSQIPVDFAVAYAGAGRKAEALAQAHRAAELLANDGINSPSADAALLIVQGMTGDRDSAIPKIAPLLERPASVTPAILRLDPMWDSFRGDPQFEKLAASEISTKGLAAPQ